ncbi:hypothetical protein ZIOFF_017620 [Zingiber officinale]|uniref:Reverse transcriptase domain-containing protein n=1 Tax=Zingiber officinale TaxID=94328 RepID=A0A8J5HJX5_ZINOF|nr:hypothetical protein ZIOFF_017620 [Zingiber officinale]
MIVSTGISMEFPDNCYARLTSRSGAAAKRRIDIGAGVIDADYRGFHQVMMDPESISWTAFLVPQGLYEWLVMSFGLKNAPAIFQRKMDNCFRNCEEFLAIYIDDILVFSDSENDHVIHLTKMLEICEKEGLVLSPSKMKIAQPEIEFLGATVGNRKIKLQQHIVKKILDFDEQKLQTLKGLRSWLGSNNQLADALSRLVHYVVLNPNDDQNEVFHILEAALEEIKDAPAMIQDKMASMIDSIIAAPAEKVACTMDSIIAAPAEELACISDSIIATPAEEVACKRNSIIAASTEKESPFEK